MSSKTTLKLIAQTEEETLPVYLFTWCIKCSQCLMQFNEI